MSANNRPEQGARENDGGSALATASRLALTVTRGRHDGARVELAQGQHLIGADVDCDVVLSDGGVALRHCILDVRAYDLTLTTMEASTVHINGHARSGSGIVVPSGAALLVGEACLIAEHLAAAPLPLAAAASGAAPPRVPDASRASGRVMDWFAAWGVMVASVAGIGMAATVPSAMNTATDERPVFDLRTLEAAFGAIGGTELLVRVGKDGQVRLDGFVGDDAAAAELRRRAAQMHGLPIEHGYQVVESLERQILGYLAERNVRLSYRGQGHFVASGRALSHRFHQRAAELSNELRGVIELDVSAVDAPRPPGEKRPLPLRIVSVQVSAPAQFSTSDGVRYFVGARLPDGAEVVSIQPDRVLFRREGRSIVYPLSREELGNDDAK